MLGNITNTGSKPVNLKGGWMIIPFSMGVHTQFEGIWKRQTNPTDYFKIYCWCACVMLFVFSFSTSFYEFCRCVGQLYDWTL